MPYGTKQTHLNHMPSRADHQIDRSVEPPSAAGAVPSGESRHARRRFLIIHNTIAGRNRIGLVQDVVRLLEQAGAVADLLSLAEGDANAKLAARIKDYDAIVASGGDGTARSIATLHSLSRRFYFIYHKQLGDLSVVANLHAEQARAAARGDEKGAQEASDNILTHAENFTKRTIISNF